MLARFKKVLVIAAVLCLFGSTQALATDFTFSGNFNYDNDVVLLYFGVAAPSTVTVFSSSWLYPPTPGVAPGGFDPMLGIWDALTGNNISFQDDGGVVGSTLSGGVLYNHGVYDSYYSVLLPAGDYIASITQFDNFPLNISGGGPMNLADGWRRSGPANRAFTFDLGWGSQPNFNGVYDIPNDPRTNYWQFHLNGVTTAVNPEVPEPGSLFLLGTGLVGAARAWKKRRG